MPERPSYSLLRAYALAVLTVLCACGGADTAPTTSPPPRQTSVAVIVYMNAALDIMQRNSINRYKIDWPKFRSDALVRVQGAVTSQDAYPGLRATIAALGDHHSSLILPGASVVSSDLHPLPLTRASAEATDPSGRILPGGIG